MVVELLGFRGLSERSEHILGVFLVDARVNPQRRIRRPAYGA